MSYYKDLSLISLSMYKEMLMTMQLVKSRMILRETIDAKFDLIENQGIENVEVLMTALKTKKKLEAFSSKSGIDLDYLSILNREMKSLLPKPNKIKDFPNVDESLATKLEELGYKDTFGLYDEINSEEKRKEFIEKTGLDINIIEALSRLCDLSRIRWVNHTFAYVLLEVEYDCVEKVAAADSKELYDVIVKKNEECDIYKGKIGVNDIKILIEWAKWLVN